MPPLNVLDIRDTVKFKEVMKQYGFGPNGAIMTSLNFFSSQFNKVVDLINKNAENVSYVVFDTPGQIEVFTWSASGTIISESLVSTWQKVGEFAALLGLCIPDSRDLCDGYTPKLQSCDIHVQYVIRLQCSVSITIAIFGCTEQGEQVDNF